MRPVPRSHRRSSSVREAVASLLAVIIAACGSSDRPATATGGRPGTYGVSFDVTVSRPANGTITSQDGRIRCGTGGAACSGRYGWSEQAVLTATPDPGYTFGTWGGDCQYTGPCTLDTSKEGADKYVVAVFGPNGVVVHGNFTSPAIHGRAYFERLAQLPGSLDCTNARCHGPTYDGAGLALSCNACHGRAGWANWQQSCSFCHGAKTDQVKAGYDFAVHPEWAAPPDDVSMRLTGTSDGAAGAHHKHVDPAVPNAVRAPIACSECHVVPETAIHTLNLSLDLPFGPLSRSQGAEPTWDAATLTCSANYCHGNFAYGSVRGASASLGWTGALNGCQTCHAMPPTGHTFGGSADPRSCSGCHPDTVLPDGTIDLAKRRHINGQKDAAGGACDACHWFPNSATRTATGAHLAHYGLTSEQGATGYGDLDTLQKRYPTATPTTAPTVYAFGCGNCHPIDMAQHSMGSGSTVAKVWLYEAAAPSDSLKARNSTAAAYDPVARTCSGVYCHSSGQATPGYRTTPAWTSTGTLTCASCHDDPPRYPSGGAGAPDANTHLVMGDDGWELGHFLGLPGPWHGSKHGAAWGPGDDAAPLTCQSCHYDTTDPSATGPSGFYWLDTTGDYQLPGGDPARPLMACTDCHGTVAAPVGAGRVLPLRHVNGRRDVVFDPRTTLPAIAWLPTAPNTPTRPYWATAWNAANLPAGAVRNGTTVSFDLTAAAYDPVSKTCSNVGCHLAEAAVRWGTTPVGWATCGTCHPY